MNSLKQSKQFAYYSKQGAWPNCKNKVDLSAIIRRIVQKFLSRSSCTLFDLGFHIDEKTDMTISTQLLMLIKNIYTLIGRSCLHLPDTYKLIIPFYQISCSSQHLSISCHKIVSYS